ILAAYRRNCSQLSPLGQLVLPEALKLLPIYVLGFLKSPAMRPGVDVPMDERIVYFNYVMKMSVQQILLYSFPRLISLHKMPDPVVSIRLSNNTKKIYRLIQMEKNTTHHPYFHFLYQRLIQVEYFCLMMV